MKNMQIAGAQCVDRRGEKIGAYACVKSSCGFWLVPVGFTAEVVIETAQWPFCSSCGVTGDS